MTIVGESAVTSHVHTTTISSHSLVFRMIQGLASEGGRYDTNPPETIGPS